MKNRIRRAAVLVLGALTTACSGEGDGGTPTDVDTPPGFDLTLTPAQLTVRQDSFTSFTAVVTRKGGFSGPVTIVNSGAVPAGMLLLSADNPITGSSGQFYVTATRQTPTGSAVLLLSAVADGLSSQPFQVPVTVEQGSRFTILIAEDSVTIPATDYRRRQDVLVWDNVAGQAAVGAEITWTPTTAGVVAAAGEAQDADGASVEFTGLGPGGTDVVGTFVDARTSIHVSVLPTEAPRFFAGSVSAGADHTCALDASGQAFCWGSNSLLQLGDGTAVDRATPVAAAGDLRFVQILAFDWRTCGLTADGATWCWGTGVLGDGTPSQSSAVPVRVAGGLSFVRLGRGPCGLTASGELYCWGTPGPVLLQPQLHSAGLRFTDYAASADGDGLDICGLVDGGTLHCGNRFGYSVVPGGPYTAVARSGLGSGSHVCVLDPDGRAFCWGANNWGQLGDGTTVSRPLPVPVETTLRFDRILTTGRAASCARVAQASGPGPRWHCWGLVGLGLAEGGGGWLHGIDSTTPEPFPLAGLEFGHLEFNQGVADGEARKHVCGVASNGGLYCWGSNESGQLGNGSATDRAVPTPVISP